MPAVPLGETVEILYAFLKGQGPERLWYCIGMGDGTRWAFVPLEQYRGGMLDGVWVSKTERWEFNGHTVRLSRDGHTGKGTFRMDGHVLRTVGMPFGEYAVYMDREHGRLTLMAREGVASILTREGGPQKPAPQAMGQGLVGNWVSGPETGHARLTISQVPDTPYYNLRLLSQGQGETACTFAVRGQELLATFRNGSRVVIRHALADGRLTLYFPNMPEITFTRQ